MGGALPGWPCRYIVQRRHRSIPGGAGMRVRAALMTAVATVLGLGASVSTQQRVPTLMSAFDYDVVPNWSLAYPTKRYAWGSVPGVLVECDERRFRASMSEM